METRAGAGIVGLAGLLWSGTEVVGAARSALARVFRQPSASGFLCHRVGLVVTTVWLGAAFAAIGWTVLKVAGAWYASRVLADSSAVYRTFAATAAAMLLLFLAARLFVYGAELNVTLLEEERGGGVMDVQRPDGQEPTRDLAEKPTPEGRSSAQLARSIGSDLVTLVRKEIELAKQEVREGIAARIKGAAALGAGAAFGLFALGFLAAAAAGGLDVVLQPWASRLIVGGTFLLVAGVAAAVGLGWLKGVPLAPRRTKETIKEDVEWARAQLRR